MAQIRIWIPGLRCRRVFRARGPFWCSIGSLGSLVEDIEMTRISLEHYKIFMLEATSLNQAKAKTGPWCCIVSCETVVSTPKTGLVRKSSMVLKRDKPRPKPPTPTSPVPSHTCPTIFVGLAPRCVRRGSCALNTSSHTGGEGSKVLCVVPSLESPALWAGQETTLPGVTWMGGNVELVGT